MCWGVQGAGYLFGRDWFGRTGSAEVWLSTCSAGLVRPDLFGRTCSAGLVRPDLFGRDLAVPVRPDLFGRTCSAGAFRPHRFGWTCLAGTGTLSVGSCLLVVFL